MNLAAKLNAEMEDKIQDHAIKVAEEIEPKLFGAAQDGYDCLSIDLRNREYAHILKNPAFREQLGTLLDGCKVEIKAAEHTDILFKNKYLKHHLLISWG